MGCAGRSTGIAILWRSNLLRIGIQASRTEKGRHHRGMPCEVRPRNITHACTTQLRVRAAITAGCGSYYRPCYSTCMYENIRRGVTELFLLVQPNQKTEYSGFQVTLVVVHAARAFI